MFFDVRVVLNLSPQSVKCVFVGYFRIQKSYRRYSPSTRKYYLSANVTFFESVSYFSLQSSLTTLETIPLPLSVSLPAPAPDVSSSMPPIDNTAQPAPNHVLNFRYVYTHRQKVPAPKRVPTDSSSPVEGPLPQPLSPFFDLDVPVALRKNKRSCTDHLIYHFVSYDRLTLSF